MIQTYDSVKFGDSRPLTDLLDQLASERKHDEIRNYSGLKLDDECKLVDGGATFTKRGFASLCRLTSMPPVMVDWLCRKDYQPQLAQFINAEIAGLQFDDGQANRPGKRIFTRFREDAKGNQLCRALFSDRYAAVDANVLVAMVADALTASEREQARVHRLTYDGDELLCNLVWPGCDRQVGGESYQVGIAIQTSEIGTLRMQIQPWIGRLVCANGLIVCTPTGQLGLAMHRRLFDRGAQAVQTLANDLIPLFLLFAVSVTGLMITASYKLMGGQNFAFLSLLHAFTVVILLLWLPFGKLFHVIQRPAQLGVAFYKEEGARGPQATCARTGEAFQSQLHHDDLAAVMKELGMDFGAHQELSPQTKRTLIALNQAAMIDGQPFVG